MNPKTFPSPAPDPDSRLEKQLATCARKQAEIDPGVPRWHAWVEYFLYCLESEALSLDRIPAFETELVEIATLITSRLVHGSWCAGGSTQDPAEGD